MPIEQRMSNSDGELLSFEDRQDKMTSRSFLLNDSRFVATQNSEKHNSHRKGIKTSEIPLISTKQGRSSIPLQKNTRACSFQLLYLTVTMRLAIAFLNGYLFSVKRRQIPRHSVRFQEHQMAVFSSSSNDDNGKLPSSSSSSNTLPLIIPTDGGVPIHLYAYEIEPDALKQLKALARSPLPIDYVCAMPDVHLGKGVTIGTVFASDKYICPNAVGVDIGCGMAAIPIEGLYRDQLSHDDKVQIQQRIKERIPTGFNQHRKTLVGTKGVLDEMSQEIEPSAFLKSQLTLPRVTDQLGTLGGGNHFLEVLYEEKTGQVWAMLHSGSRNIGNRTAMHYDRVAKHLLESQGTDTAALRGLNYMPIESQEGQDYMHDMTWCQKYAFHNRRVMKEMMLEIIHSVTGKDADMKNSVNIHHNYCTCEDCGGRMLWVTRKGATSAKLGEMGIIPGSMGTGSYITRGKGNLMGWNSSSHGAGRRMSRTRAHAEIPQGDFEESMRGIVCDTIPSVKDEAPQAYKNLSEVMEHQNSLTEIVYRLLPIINVKGFETKVPKKYLKKKAKKNKI